MTARRWAILIASTVRAIKILPDEFSRDPERIVGFHREAQAMTSSILLM